MKKVCFVNPTILLKRPIAEIIGQLSGNKEYKIGLLMPKKIFSEIDQRLHYSRLPKNVEIFEYSILQPPGSFEWPIPFDPRFFSHLYKIFTEYDIIHMWTYFYLNNLFVFLGKLFFPNKKLILTCDTIPGYSFSAGSFIDSALRSWTTFWDGIIFRVSNVITLYGKSLVPYALKAGIPKRKIKITPTGVYLKKYSKPKKSVRKEFGIMNDENVALFIGIINKRKGVGTMIKTVQNLEGENLKVLIVGDGPDKKKYEKLVKKLGLENQIIFTGFRKDVDNFYKSADFFFFPSRGEGLAGVIMEAMASGLPIVSTDIPCTSDLVKNEQNGYLCEIDDVNTFVKKVQALLKDKSKLSKMGKRSQELIKKFEWKNAIKSFEELY